MHLAAPPQPRHSAHTPPGQKIFLTRNGLNTRRLLPPARAKEKKTCASLGGAFDFCLTLWLPYAKFSPNITE